MKAVWWLMRDTDIFGNLTGKSTLNVKLMSEDSYSYGADYSKEFVVSMSEAKDEMIKNIVKILEESYKEMEKELCNS